MSFPCSQGLHHGTQMRITAMIVFSNHSGRESTVNFAFEASYIIGLRRIISRFRNLTTKFQVEDFVHHKISMCLLERNPQNSEKYNWEKMTNDLATKGVMPQF